MLYHTHIYTYSLTNEEKYPPKQKQKIKRAKKIAKDQSLHDDKVRKYITIQNQPTKHTKHFLP